MTELQKGEIAIVGAGIAGLAFALNLHARGIACRVFEAAPVLREIGVGITVLPHAMRELTALGLADAIVAQGIETQESAYYNRFGQLIYKEARGRFAGYPVAEVGIHRGRLHGTLYRAVLERLGPDSVVTDHECTGLEQDADKVTLSFRRASTKEPLEPVVADIAIACDGVNSAVRRSFYPGEQLVFAGINSWRGVTRMKPILGGRTYMRIGSVKTGKLTIYPIADDVDGQGNQLINWVAQLPAATHDRNDWNKTASPETILPKFQSWVFDWLDVPQMIASADAILEYPMVDKDPIKQWTFGRVTLAGDAAHPMYPRGSNGSAQAMIDVRVLADLLSEAASPLDALARYETIRQPETARVVLSNRNSPPDVINTRVEELTGDRPFTDLDSLISRDELRGLLEKYERAAKFSRQDVG